VINGLTGAGKTALLRYMAGQGCQVLDLEDLAAHRSSLLGRYTDRPQPSQCGFENALCSAIAGLDLGRPVYVEAESRKVGNVQVPDALWFNLMRSPVVVLEVGEAARVAHLLEVYAHFLHGAEWQLHLKQRLDVLRSRYGHEKVDAWHELADGGQWGAFTLALLREHYDPMYRAGGRYAGAFAKVELARVAVADHAVALRCIEALDWDAAEAGFSAIQAQ
jgi:tRNA 2-selenouridine synthase